MLLPAPLRSLLLATLTLAFPFSQRQQPSSGPVIASDFPDPSIIHVNDTWYAFGTQSMYDHQDIRVQLATSIDFETWTLTGHDAMVCHSYSPVRRQRCDVRGISSRPDLLANREPSPSGSIRATPKPGPQTSTSAKMAPSSSITRPARRPEATAVCTASAPPSATPSRDPTTPTPMSLSHVPWSKAVQSMPQLSKTPTTAAATSCIRSTAMRSGMVAAAATPSSPSSARPS